MTSSRATKIAFALLCALALAAGADEGKTIGKNPGKIQGRWLKAKDPAALKGQKGVYLGELTTDIQWKNERNEAPIDEDLLQEYLHDQLVENLKTSRVFGEVLDEAPAEGEDGYVRLDCNLQVEPGSRAMRYFVGFGAGKSRSILEIHIHDHASGDELGLYHGYGVGSGMGFKLAGGGARKMTQDDVQENAAEFVKLVGQIR